MCVCCCVLHVICPLIDRDQITGFSVGVEAIESTAIMKLLLVSLCAFLLGKSYKTDTARPSVTKVRLHFRAAPTQLTHVDSVCVCNPLQTTYNTCSTSLRGPHEQKSIKCTLYMYAGACVCAHMLYVPSVKCVIS